MRKFSLACFVVFYAFGWGGLAQSPVQHIDQLDTFFEQEEKTLLLLGENHSSAVGSTLYPGLIETFNTRYNVSTLFIEFGPSEAYFYNQYLATGDEKLLNFTISAGYYKGWKKAWQKIYAYNQSLEKPLHFIGVDFDRTRTFAYCLYKIFKPRKDNPKAIDSLMTVIKDPSFFNSYTVGYPTAKDKAFVSATKAILRTEWEGLRQSLPTADLNYLSQLLDNEVKGFKGSREADLKENILRAITKSDDKNFFMLIGRDHTYKKAIYDTNPRLAKLLLDIEGLKTWTGLILHENSKQWGKDYKEAILLSELQTKVPWKKFYDLIKEQIPTNFTYLPMTGKLSPLAVYVDFILIAKNQEAIEI